MHRFERAPNPTTQRNASYIAFIELVIPALMHSNRAKRIRKLRNFQTQQFYLSTDIEDTTNLNSPYSQSGTENDYIFSIHLEFTGAI